MHPIEMRRARAANPLKYPRLRVAVAYAGAGLVACLTAMLSGGNTSIDNAPLWLRWSFIATMFIIPVLPWMVWRWYRIAGEASGKKSWLRAATASVLVLVACALTDWCLLCAALAVNQLYVGFIAHFGHDAPAHFDAARAKAIVHVVQVALWLTWAALISGVVGAAALMYGIVSRIGVVDTRREARIAAVAMATANLGMCFCFPNVAAMGVILSAMGLMTYAAFSSIKRKMNALELGGKTAEANGKADAAAPAEIEAKPETVADDVVIKVPASERELI